MQSDSLDELVSLTVQKSKKRFSLILLDLFIGGFVVGIVLMMPLSRPPSEALEVGAGGPQFMMIEYFWKDNGRLFVPIISHATPNTTGHNTEVDKRIGKYGLGAPWGHDGSRLWPAHNRESGSISGMVKRFDNIQMDGFFLDSDRNMTEELLGGAGGHYAYIWMSMPCSGKWTFGIRELDRLYKNKGNEPFNIRLKIRFEGYNNDQQDNDSIGQSKFINNESLAARGVSEGLLDSSESNNPRVRAIEIERRDDVAFDYCPES